MKGKVIAAMLMAAVTLGAGSAAHADDNEDWDFAGKFSITAGLDSKTRKLIKRMPEELRKQVIIGLSQALPMIDRSVFSYLAEVDRILEKSLDSAACSVVGSGKTLLDILGAKVTLGDGPRPIRDLKRMQDSEVRGYSSGDKPGEYADGYGELLANVYWTSCQVKASPQTLVRLDPIREDTLWRWTVWWRMEDLCDSAAECVAKQHAIVTSVIAGSDARDLDLVQAQAKLAAIKIPKVPPLGLGFRQAPFEEVLRSLLGIEDSIRVARLARHERAQKIIDSLSAQLTSVDQQLTAAQGLVAHYDRSKNNLALKQLSSVDVDLISARSLGSEALKQAPEFEQQVQPQASRIETYAARALEIKADIDRFNAEAERRRQEELNRRDSPGTQGGSGIGGGPGR